MTNETFCLSDLDDTAAHVVWVREPNPANPDNPRKVPYSPRTLRKAYGKHSTWGGTRAAALKFAKELEREHDVGGLGIVLGTEFAGYRLVGVDLDNCRDPDLHTIAPWARTIIKRFNTYWEVSPSGTGVKGYMLCPESEWQDMGKVNQEFKRPGLIGEKEPGIEVYSESRYFAVTDNLLRGSTKTLAIVSGDEFKWISAVAGPEYKGVSPRSVDTRRDVTEHNNTLALDGDLDRLESVLEHIDPEEHSGYRAWFDVVCAIHHETRGSDEGLDLALEWSRGCIDNKGDSDTWDDELRSKWPGLGKGDGRRITGAYLLKLAIKAGYSIAEVHFDDERTSETRQRDMKRSNVSMSAHTMADLEKVTDLYDFVEDVLYEGQLSEILGIWKGGKTFFALDLCLHIATGRTWFGKDVDQGAILFVALEGLQGIKRRIKAWCKHHDVDPVTLPITVASGRLDLREGKAAREWMIDQVRKLEARTNLPVRLIVIDTLNRAMAGGNESSSEDMGKLIAGADHIRIASKSALMLIHHPGKDESRGSRGHSSLPAAIDTEIRIEGEKWPKVATIHYQKEGETGARFPFRLEPVTLDYFDRRGKPVISAVAVPDSRLVITEEGGNGRERVAMRIFSRMMDWAKLDAGDNFVWESQFRARLKTASWPERDSKPDAFRQAWNRLLKSSGFSECITIEDGRMSPKRDVRDDA